MLYLNETHVKQLGVEWNDTIATIGTAVRCLAEEDYAQPVKPYLRYKDKTNRIIAMPAYVGGDIQSAGIKWIASFPKNIDRGLPRASSVMILNDVETGQPVGVLNTALLSVIRTASVSGLMIKHFVAARPRASYKVGIIGFGPIGQYHAKMCQAVLGSKLSEMVLFDIRGIDVAAADLQDKERVRAVQTWQEAYADADIFITCTVSSKPYINEAPKPGSLQLNVSLRDYEAEAIYPFVQRSIIVDDWEEVCREKTDIEMMHLQAGLQKEQTKSIVDVVIGDCMRQYDADAPIMFNPMGMASFDIAIGSMYARQAVAKGIGQLLD
ncbi:2,3-diaminopropionate biosynthesis protein SbnB [Paenibacillus chartarius]|uniref:2,3-diaminopropionate biosynthesis protein SbnB n=1 Tax=Paenibacillus chartarius TaxID=747481 RepID=A0ABV6DTC6_9BACL